MLSLQLMQSGLSWTIVLKKADGFAQAFDNWDIKKVR